MASREYWQKRQRDEQRRRESRRAGRAFREGEEPYTDDSSVFDDVAPPIDRPEQQFPGDDMMAPTDPGADPDFDAEMDAVADDAINQLNPFGERRDAAEEAQMPGGDGGQTQVLREILVVLNEIKDALSTETAWGA